MLQFSPDSCCFLRAMQVPDALTARPPFPRGPCSQEGYLGSRMAAQDQVDRARSVLENLADFKSDCVSYLFVFCS